MPWIKYKYYTRIRPDGSFVYNPIIEVHIKNGNKIAKNLGLIDSGCEDTLIRIELSKILEIDLSNAKKVNVGGITGSTIGYATSVKMKLKDFDYEFDAPVIFVKELSIPILLGQNNFFEQFKVKFEKKNNRFGLMKE